MAICSDVALLVKLNCLEPKTAWESLSSTVCELLDQILISQAKVVLVAVACHVGEF